MWIAPLAGGVIAIAAAVRSFFSNDEFYLGKYSHHPDDKPLPKWLGRLFFFGTGLTLVYVSLSEMKLLPF